MDSLYPAFTIKNKYAGACTVFSFNMLIALIFRKQLNGKNLLNKKFVLHRREHAGQKITASELTFNEIATAYDNSKAESNLHSAKNLLVFTGPPLHTEKDNEHSCRLISFPGRKVICGGTTANIVSRELGRTIETQMASGGIPGISIMEGVDLITEGILTLTRVLNYLKDPPPEKTDDAAVLLSSLLKENDCITFMVGGKINQAYSDSEWPIELIQRETAVRQIAGILRDKYLKKIEIEFI